MAAGDVMTGSIIALVGDFIELRRGLGYRSPSQERALRAFARYLDGQAHDGTVRLTMIMIYFTKVNTRCGGHTRHAVGHFVFALAMSIMIMVNLTVPSPTPTALCLDSQACHTP